MCEQFIFKTYKHKLRSEIRRATDIKTIDRIITHACLSGERLKVLNNK